MLDAFFIFIFGTVCFAGLVYVFAYFQARQRAREQTQRQKLALELSPTYQQMLDSQHRRAIETRKLDWQETVWQETTRMQWAMLSAGLQSGYQVELREAGKLLPPPVRVQEVKQEQLALPSGYPAAPPFASIKSLIQPGKLILGYNTSGPIYGDVKDLLSMLFAGKPGTGKSTALLYYLSMLLLVDASVYVFDHQGSLSELSDFLPYFGSFKEFSEPMPAIYEEIREREELWRQSKTVKKPLLILADELPAVARYEDKNKVAYSLLELAEETVLGYRKYNMYCLLTGQSFPAEILPTITRDNCSSRLLFNSSDSHARMAGLDSDSRKRMLPLLRKAPQGTAILDVSRRAEPDIVAIPYTTVDDARMIVSAGNVPDFRNIYTGVPEASRAVPDDRNGNADLSENVVPVSSQERERIIELAKSGVPRREICAELGVGKWFYDTVKYVLDQEGL